MDFLKVFLLFLGAYFLGSIPFALIIALPQGIDPRKEGSRNPGATNVARLLGKKWGILTFLGDSGKGILALLIAFLLIPQLPFPKELILAGTGFFAILGHLFSVFLKFKGGKGVATTIGIFLILTPKAILLAFLFFLLGVIISGFVSVGSLLAATLLPLFIYFFNYSEYYLYISVILCLLIWFKHRENLKRLFKGEEKSWKKTFNS